MSLFKFPDGILANQIPSSPTLGGTSLLKRWNNIEAPQMVDPATVEDRRLYIGGLPRFDSQYACHNQLEELFKAVGVEVEGL